MVEHFYSASRNPAEYSWLLGTGFARTIIKDMQPLTLRYKVNGHEKTNYIACLSGCRNILKFIDGGNYHGFEYVIKIIGRIGYMTAEGRPVGDNALYRSKLLN